MLTLPLFVIILLSIEDTLCQKSNNIQENPVSFNLIGTHRKNKKEMYVTKEEIEKALIYDHPCNLTETNIRISFPESLSMGHRGTNTIKVSRCLGWCTKTERPILCKATRVRAIEVNMKMRSFQTGRPLKEELKELIFDEHIECGCECEPELSYECLHMFNKATCQCECPDLEFGEKKLNCKMNRDVYWDSHACQCKKLSHIGIDYLEYDHSSEARGDKFSSFGNDTHTGDMIPWVLFGSSMTLIILLTLATLHYKRRLDMLRDGDMAEQIIR